MNEWNEENRNVQCVTNERTRQVGDRGSNAVVMIKTIVNDVTKDWKE